MLDPSGPVRISMVGEEGAMDARGGGLVATHI